MPAQKKTRLELEQYFAKNSIPTSSNFADLIASALNQSDDGIKKGAGDPISVAAAIHDHKPILNLHVDFTKAASWGFCLAPRSAVANVSRNGLSIGSSPTAEKPMGESRLFVSGDTGNVGIGTVDPLHKLEVNGGILASSATITGAIVAQSTVAVTSAVTAQSTLDVTGKITARAAVDVAGKLTAQSSLAVTDAITAQSTLDVTGKITARSTVEIQGKITASGALDANGLVSASGGVDIKTIARSGAHPSGRALYVTGAISDTEGVEFRKSDASQGLGFGATTIYAAGSDAKQDICLVPKGPTSDPGAVRVKSALYVTGKLDAASVSMSTLSVGTGSVAATSISDTIAIKAGTSEATTIPTMNAVRTYIQAVAPSTASSIDASTDGTKLATVGAVRSLIDKLAPIGMIIMWQKSELPSTNWAWCDGTNGTPDLRDRFVLAKGTSHSTIGSKGGQSSVTLGSAHVPRHSHSVSMTFGLREGVVNSSAREGGFQKDSVNDKSRDYTRTYSGSTDSWGGGDSNGNASAHENMPPYYVLAFIMRIS